MAGHIASNVAIDSHPALAARVLVNESVRRKVALVE
jgi:hypothetical protein